MELPMMKPNFYMMTGVPCSGKSTLIEKGWFSGIDYPYPTTILSTDNILESWAKIENISYKDAFDLHFKGAEQKMKDDLAKCMITKLYNVIWDQTNLTAKTRKRKLSWMGNNREFFTLIGIGFYYKPEDIEVLVERNLARAQATGKYVPTGQVREMFQTYERPSIDEGFEHVYIFDIDGKLVYGEPQYFTEQKAA
jgi:predicted kinase